MEQDFEKRLDQRWYKLKIVQLGKCEPRLNADFDMKAISAAIHALTGTWIAKLSCKRRNMQCHHPPYQSDCKGPASYGAFVALASNIGVPLLTAFLKRTSHDTETCGDLTAPLIY